jgi:TPP-dependent indolepyruvate ferredoxin oxidoreductase alpha subunit
MGNGAIAYGALKAGVNLVSGYPGTPSSEIVETVAKAKPEGVHVEWSVNEKAAMEVAAAASYSGARTLVTMKQVGLNVASDPLMSLAYVGVKGGMVVVSADDPGPISSQTEQDTRRFAEFARIPVFDPSSPEEAYEMIQDARGVPLSAEKCVIERDRALDLLDEISNQLPGELKQARTIVESRGEVINNAKREAENILKQAQAQARQMVSDDEIYRQAQQEANAMVQAAQDRIRELKNVTNNYVDDALKQTEQAISEALNEVKESRAKFNALVGAQNKNAKPAPNPAIIEEVD